MQIIPYLLFNGDCKSAFRFYEGTLGGKLVTMQTHGESPMKDQVPADWHDKVIHAHLALGDFALMGSDAPPDHYSKPQGTHVSINVTDRGEGERIFNALAEGGQVTMPFAQTFWSPGFGMVVDRFGTPWMVNCEPS